MPMRRYLIASALALVLGFTAVWAWTAAMPLAFLDPEYASWRAKQVLLEKCDLGDVVVVGDSRAAAGVIPALLPMPATNLAVGGGKPVEALTALRRIMACPAPPRLVLISFDMSHFIRPDLFWERSARFGWLDAAELETLRRDSRALHDMSVWDEGANDGLPSPLRGLLTTVRFPPLYFGSVVRGGGFFRLWRNQAALRATFDARGYYSFGTEPGSHAVAFEGGLHRFDPSPLLDQYFRRMLELLAAHRIPAVFVALPVNDATFRAVRPAVQDAFAAYLADYASRFPGFRLHGPVLPHWPDRYFGDAFSHLNQAGAIRFTQTLAARLGASPDEAPPITDQRLQAAPPSTQNDAQNGWFSATGRAASFKLRPSSKSGS
jgi:hypothetical protein